MWGTLNSDYHILQGIAMPFTANDRDSKESFLFALSVSTSASDSGGRGKLASIQPRKSLP